MHPIKPDSSKAIPEPPLSGGPAVGVDHWSFFDGIYCISLDERADRRQDAMAQFAQVGLADRVEFVVVRKHPTDCEEGIYQSHLTCMAKGLNAGHQRMLIFEDDIVFDRFSPENLSNCVRFLRQCDGWHAFFLGCMVKKSQRTPNPSVLRIRYRSLSHAYAVSRDFAEILVKDHPWNHVSFDAFLRDLNSDQMFGAYPAFAFQSDSPSDNDRYLPLDRFRRVCGGLRSIQKRNEWYHRHKWTIITGHALILAAALAWVGWP